MKTAALFIAALVFAFSLAGQASDRFLDQAPERDATVRLAIFNPELGNIQTLSALRKLGIFNQAIWTWFGAKLVESHGRNATQAKQRK